MKIGIMGGTFDPIHIGHLIAAETARNQVDLDEVWFIPTFAPPHKQHIPIASPAQRWNMLCDAVLSNPYFRPIDIELQKGGISYSIDTLLRLCDMHSTYQWKFIIGADMLEVLPKWVRIDEILQLAHFIVLSRPGHSLTISHLPTSFHDHIQLVPMPQLEISSSRIRHNYQYHQENRYFLPEKVHAFIKENHLYGT